MSINEGMMWLMVWFDMMTWYNVMTWLVMTLCFDIMMRCDMMIRRDMITWWCYVICMLWLEYLLAWPIKVVPAWVSFRITTYLGLLSPTRLPVWHGYRYDSSDSRGSSQPDCRSVSFGYATDQNVLGVPSGHRRPDFVPTGAHVARVRERASY